MALVVIATFFGCASNSAPKNWLPTATDAQSTAYGGWLDLVYYYGVDQKTGSGELIAVTLDSIYWLEADGLHTQPRRATVQARITAFDANSSSFTAWTILGTLSTASHGILSPISATLWIIGGSVSAASRSFEAVEKSTYAEWDEIGKYARYPSGIPAGLDRSRIVKKPLEFRKKARKRRRP